MPRILHTSHPASHICWTPSLFPPPRTTTRKTSWCHVQLRQARLEQTFMGLKMPANSSLTNTQYFAEPIARKKKLRSISNRLKSKLSHSPKRWSDLARIINFQSFVKMKFQNVKYMFPPITPCRQKLIIVLLMCPPRRSVLRAVKGQIQHNN